MKKLLTFTLVLALASLAQAATFDWNGGAADGDWYNSANWTVTGSTYTHPADGGAYGYYTNTDVGIINITNGDTVQTGIGGSGNCSPGTSSSGLLNITNGSTFNVTGNLWVCDPETGVAFDVNVDGSTFNTGGYMDFGNGAFSTVNVTATNSTMAVGNDLKFANHNGSSVNANIVNSTFTVVDKLYLNDGGGTASYSSLTMDATSSITTGSNCYINDDAGLGSAAYITLNGGTINSGGTFDVSWNLDGLSHVTINGGTVTAANAIRFGVSIGSDLGQSRIFLNGGLLKGEDLQFTMTDSLIVFTGGKIQINNAAVDEVAMQTLVDTGRIDVSGSYVIYNDKGYTTLVPEPATMALLGLGSLALLRRRKR